MKFLAVSIAAAAALATGLARAHAHLEKATPAEGSTLTASPPALELTFSEAARVTALWIQKDQEPKQPIKNVPTTSGTTLHVALPTLTTGDYSVTWRVLGADGHVTSGALHFRISTTPTSSAPEH
jgi:methionine-rich copper-binding protein CopC